MKIALIHERFRPDGGGLERHLHAFSAALAERGHEVHVVTADEAPGALPPGVELHQVPLVTRSKKARLRLFAERSPAVVRKLGVDRSIGLGRTFEHDVHRAGAGGHAAFQVNLPWFKRMRAKNRLELELERRLYEGGGTRTFVVNSERVGEEVRKHYRIGDRPIQVIRTAVDSARFCPGDRERALAAIDPSLNPEAPVFLFVSLDHKRKGLDLLLEAFRHLKGEAELWILGSAPKAQWRALIDRHPRNRWIRRFETADPVAFYQAADFYVLPTRYDACANTTLQALASGTPGIVSSFDGASEFIEPGESGWILGPDLDSRQLAELMDGALTLCREEKTRIGRNARERVSALTWERHLRNWEELLQRQP